MSKHNELRDRINELCPELMKLEFGCEVEVMRDRLFMSDAYIYDKWIVSGFESKYPNLKLFLVNREYCFHNTKTLSCIDEVGKKIDFGVYEVKILGKDPTLEDVMRAIEKSGGCYEFNGKLAMGKNPFEKEDVEWQLGFPLSQQSDETIKAILEILK